MAEDPAIRRNRLALLAAVQSLFANIADFRQIAAG
jgi:glycyl-tRNA synthetase beta subunit